jgi:ribosomal protein S18 acetylase RimI-like enzyme
MSTTIRTAALGDEALLAVLNGFVHELHVANRPEHFRPTRVEHVSAWFRSLLQKPAVLIWIAEEDGVPVGYVSALLHEREENPFCSARRWCEIDQIAVDDKWRRRGIARTLVQTALAEVRRRGIREVEMSSWSFNETAHHAFRRLGFAPQAIRFGLTLPE